MSKCQQKKQLRSQLLRQRQSLSVATWREKSDRLAQKLANCTLFQEAKTILAYFSFKQEPDLSCLWQGRERRWGFPRIENDSLVWHYWQPHEPLARGAHGIPEPLSHLPPVNPDDVDLILVPAIACDRQGYRLGYGGGFYDRLFSQPQWQNIPAVGIVFDFAHLDALPVEPWDRKLDKICSDQTDETAKIAG